MRFAQLALDCVHREYPNHISHTLNGPEDVGEPHQLTPVFFGCYDWHSSVHGHWLLARLARLYPRATYAVPAMAALKISFTPSRLGAEVKYLSAQVRVSFERPYGLAWLLQLAAELREWDHEQARSWSQYMRPLESLASQRLADWLHKLDYPIRIGEHSQTAFALGLVLDWSRTAGDREMEQLLVERINTYYADDRDCPLSWEPGGHDFLSPCIAEADLMRRILPPGKFANWLSGFLPAIPVHGGSDWLAPVVVSDPGDPKLAHLDGLNLSRAWMLDGIASALPGDDPRLAAIKATAGEHRARGLEALTGGHYEGGHWLGSFAIYLLTQRGLR